VARTEVITVGGLLLLVAIIAYYLPISFTLADETMSATIPRMVAFCESLPGQFAQLSPEMVLVCSEYNTFMFGIYGSGLLGIILIIVGAVTGKDKDLVYDVETGKTEYRDEDDESLDIIKKRYAKGEITKEEFVNMKNDLEGNMPIQNYKPEKKAEPKKDIQYKTQPEWNLKKSLILRGVIIGIIASLIIWGALPALTYQSYVMTSDAMEPTIMEGDRVSYTKTPFSQISVNDIIAFTDQDDSSRVLLNKVVRVYGNVVEVRNEESSTVRIVTEDQYIGKINSIEAVSGLLSVLLIPYLLFFLMAVAFVIPIIIMKIREKKI